MLLLLTALLAAGPAAGARGIALVGGTLIDGTDHPPRLNSVVLIDSGRIVSVGTADQLAIPTAMRRIDTRGQTVLPGLINTHVHFSLAGHNDYSRWEREFSGSRLRQEIFPAVARALLNSGVTTVRDLGGDIDDMLWLREQIREHRFPGPRVLVAGPLLCTAQRKFSGSLSSAGKYWRVSSPADGRAKVRELKRRGVDVVKLWDDQFTPAQLTAIISEAHANELPVAAHLLTLEGIQNAVAAGLSAGDSLEHIGASAEESFPEDLVHTIVDRRIAVSPTVIAFEGLWQMAQDPHVLDDARGRSALPPAVYSDILESLRGDPRGGPIYHWAFELREPRAAKVRQLHEAGAFFTLGTDSGSRGNPHHESEWREMVLLKSQGGLSNEEVIQAATRNAAQVLRMSDQVGTLEPGKVADITVIAGDPLTHLEDIRKVALVLQGGIPVCLHGTARPPRPRRAEVQPGTETPSREALPCPVH
jgi:imidazolonepropionase-like amidohydrolase